MNPLHMTDNEYDRFLLRSVRRAENSWGSTPSGFFDLKSDHEVGLVNEAGVSEDEFFQLNDEGHTLTGYDNHTWTEAPVFGFDAAHMHAEGSEAYHTALHNWRVSMDTYTSIREAGWPYAVEEEDSL